MKAKKVNKPLSSKENAKAFLEWARINRFLNYADDKWFRYESAGKGLYQRVEKTTEQLYSMYSK